MIDENQWVWSVGDSINYIFTIADLGDRGDFMYNWWIRDQVIGLGARKSL